MMKGVTHAHLGPIWYHSEPSDVPYSPNQFLGRDFFSASYSSSYFIYFVFNVKKFNVLILLVSKYLILCVLFFTSFYLFQIRMLGKAKHEPCGEDWDVTYGESAWRLAIMAMCLSPDFDRKRLVKISLTSAFTW